MVDPADQFGGAVGRLQEHAGNGHHRLDPERDFASSREVCRLAQVIRHVRKLRRRANPFSCHDEHGDCSRSHSARQRDARSEEHTSELPSLMRTSYAVSCLKKKNIKTRLIYNTTVIELTHDFKYNLT